jgi:hypothetical protein
LLSATPTELSIMQSASRSVRMVRNMFFTTQIYEVPPTLSHSFHFPPLLLWIAA